MVPALEFFANYFSTLEQAIRHQGKIWPQSYYWLVFIVELLFRDFDDFESDKLPLEYQLYLENYVTSPLISFYCDNHFCTFCFNDYESSNGMEQTEIDDLVDEHYVTKKMIALVELQINKNKSKLLKLCKTEKITPIRALWLYSVPLSFEEISDLIQNIKNKYIRASLFWVAGFQQIELVKNLIMNNTEKDAFEMGMKSITTYNLRLKNKKLEFLSDDFDYNYKPTGDIKQFYLYQVDGYSNYDEDNNTPNETDTDIDLKIKDIRRENYYKLTKAFEILNNTPHDKVSHKEVHDLLTHIDYKVNQKLYPLNPEKETSNNNGPRLVELKEELTVVTSPREDCEKFYSYYPFYISDFWLENMDIGCSGTYEYYIKIYKGLANEYKNYYKNNLNPPLPFLDQNEDIEYLFLDEGIFKLSETPI